jgi:multiple sugar transport system permease protein
MAATTRPQRSSRWLDQWKKRETWMFYLAISPWLVGFLIWTAGPMIYSLYLSFTRWDLFTDPVWINFENYQTLYAQDPDFWQALRVTAVYTFVQVPLSLFGALAIALLMNSAVRGITVFRTIFYLPSVLPAIAVSVLWIWVFNPEFGILNALLRVFGIEGPKWLADPRWALWALIFMSLWSLGGGMIIYLAGLKGIPRALYEAADLDGAGPVQQLWHITIPQITPAIFFNLVMGIIGSLQVFTQAYAMTSGGPQKSTLFYMYYLFDMAFIRFRMGYASALAWVLFVIILVFTLLVIRSSNLWVYYESERK